MLAVLNNEQLNQRDQAALAIERAISGLTAATSASAIASYVQRCYQEAYQARDDSGVTERLLDAQRRRNAKYSSKILAQIREMGGSELHTHDTEIKCNTAEAIITEVLMPFREKIWFIQPTPIPELPVNLQRGIVEMTMMSVQQQVAQSGVMPSDDEIREFAENLRDDVEEAIRLAAKDKSENMSLKIEDQLADMGFGLVFDEFKSNLVTFGTGIFKGPIVAATKEMQWVGDEYTVAAQFGLSCSAPAPLDLFPCGDSKEVDDGFVIERMLVSGKELSQKKGVQYWKTSEIEQLLNEQPSGYRNPTLQHDMPRSVSEEKADPSQNLGRKYELLEMWDDFAGALLEEWGIKGLNPTEFYSCQAIICGNRVLKVMPNPDPLGRRPYFKATYKKVVGSFWGNGVPHLIADAQDLANACVRAISNNMGFSSGPMVAIDCSRLPPGTEIESLHPWQLFQFTNPAGATSKPIEFITIPVVVDELMRVYDKCLNRMDDESGLPSYQYGSDKAAGAGRTMGGLSMLMNASTRVIKESMASVDGRVVEPFIRRMYEWNMLYSDDASIKGDAKIVTRGATGAILRDMKLDRISQFAQQTANPIDLQILGLPGRATLLREQAKMLDLGDAIEAMIPEGRELEERFAQTPVMPEPGGRNSLGTPTKNLEAVTPQ